MLAMASKARGLRSFVWEMKFPAALLTSHQGAVAPDPLDHLLDRGGDADIDGDGCRPGGLDISPSSPWPSPRAPRRGARR